MITHPFPPLPISSLLPFSLLPLLGFK